MNAAAGVVLEASGLVRSLDLAGLGLAAPRDGRLAAVVFTGRDCRSCSTLAARLGGIDDYCEVTEVDLAGTSAAALAAVGAGMTRIPTLVLVSADGDVVRSWVGEPLQGVLEGTIAAALGL